MQQTDNIELRSAEFQEILGKIPNWIVRSGIFMIFIFILLFIFALAFIKYPEKVEGRAILTTNIPPLSIITQSSGRLRLLVEENKSVSYGETLAYIESGANVNQVLEISAKLKRIINNPQKDYEEIYKLVDYNLVLGNLQGSYLLLTSHIERYRLFLRTASSSARIAAIRREIEFLTNSNKKLKSQLDLSIQSDAILRKRFRADSLLATERVIAPYEFDNTKRNVLEYQKNLDNIYLNIYNNAMQLAQQNSQLEQLERNEYTCMSSNQSALVVREYFCV